MSVVTSEFILRKNLDMYTLEALKFKIKFIHTISWKMDFNEYYTILNVDVKCF